MAKKKVNAAGAEDTMRSRVPALDAYLTRIGAEELNFRRYMVKEYRKGQNYYVEKTLIKLNADLTITCSRDVHAPTDEERKAISEQAAKTDVPKSIEASLRAAQQQAEKIGGEVYLFQNRITKNITMLQHKWVNPEGAKVYISWTFWSDGEWRKMEPDGKLPFWKPILGKGKKPVGLKMIHEGVKAAKFITELLENKEALAKHPWGRDLEKYEHWGMIGGALAPHRTDYDELHQEKPTQVVYVCDNDFSGASALQVVSECYGESLIGIKFGSDFKMSWDMADDIPASFYAGKGEKRRYIGQPLSHFMKPATWATEVTPIPGTKRVSISMRKPFLEEWVHSIRPEVYMHRDWAYDMWTISEFNNKVRPFSNTDDTARLMKVDDTSKAAIIKYDPSRKSGVYEDMGAYINTHMESDIKPEAGDASPFIEFMNHLIENDADRHELMRWCATLISRPDIKMNYGVLLISEMQGVGKGTLGEKILAPLVGQSNVSYPSENEIVDSQFNYWLAHKRLAVVHEIYAGQSSKAYNRLKSIVTDRYVSVNKKHMANYDIENWLHIFACSNSMRAIKLSMDDRRWFLPKVTGKKKPKTYWLEFNDWLKNQGGLGIIKHWANRFLEDNEAVQPGAESPWSSVKAEVVEDGYSPGMRLVAATLLKVKTTIESDDEEEKKECKEWEAKGMLTDGKVIILDVDLVRLIGDVIYQGRQTDKLEKPMTMRKLAKSLGWHVGNIVVSTGMKSWGANACTGRIISNDPDMAATSPAILGGKTGEKNGAVQIKPLSLDFARTM